MADTKRARAFKVKPVTDPKAAKVSTETMLSIPVTGPQARCSRTRAS
jgi:hypothetical protein